MSDAKYAMFIKAVDKKSLALAAQELCCTPSAVSHGISALETELGLRLMKRSRGGVVLKLFVPYADFFDGWSADARRRRLIALESIDVEIVCREAWAG